jgi:hypothetical protein
VPGEFDSQPRKRDPSIAFLAFEQGALMAPKNAKRCMLQYDTGFGENARTILARCERRGTHVQGVDACPFSISALKPIA